jgi:hypothetical protein
VELHYPIDWNWKGRGTSDVAPRRHILGKFTHQNTATKELAVKTISQMMARRFNAIALADATNWAWYQKLKNYYTPVLPIQLAVELNDVKGKRQRRECFDELVRPFSIGAARIDLSDVKFVSGTRVPKRVIERLAKSQQRMDIRGIRFTGEANGRKIDMGLIFEIHPLIADYDKREAYHPVVVGLAIFRRLFVGDDPAKGTPAEWPQSDREEFWQALLRAVEKLPGMLIPKTENQQSVILSVNSTLKIPAEHWQPENRSADIKKVADALSQFGELDGFDVKQAKSISAEDRSDVCLICSWIHDAGFTQIKISDDKVVTLGGILPDIVALVHRAHEKGLPGLSTKDEELLKTCGGYKHPCKAFDDLNHRNDYKILFETRKRGFISLHGALGINRIKSEAGPE